MLGYCDIMENLNASLNHNQSDILRQRTGDVEVKKQCVTLLEKFGSLSYTRRTLEELDAEVRAEVAKLGGNPILEDVLYEMLIWKWGTHEKHPEM
jgi:geranylgeranyl diphosphate synthase type 3